MMELIVIISIIYLIINSIVASMMRNVAMNKGYDDSVHAWAKCFWLGIAGWIYVMALPDLIVRRNQEKIIEQISEFNIGNRENLDKNRLPEL